MGSYFDRDEAQKALLRTHTTVNTVKHIAENPGAFQSVWHWKVFRQETIDRTHMPEFHQIEGIIHEPEASLPMLVTTLKTFYAKWDIGCQGPSSLPYEPSAEVDILWRGEWQELGGSGIFRPEVTEPIGTEWPSRMGDGTRETGNASPRFRRYQTAISARFGWFRKMPLI